MGRRLGLILGINQYQDATFRPLQFAETDARALAQWLVNARGGNWTPADLQLVLGAQATRELAVSLITQVCIDVAGPGDLVLIYFAGQSLLDITSGEGYLALANTRYQNPTTGLHLMTAMRHAIGRSRADNILVILDCFQTGPIWSVKRTFPYDFKPLLGPALLDTLQQTEGQVLFFSCRGNEQAPEQGEKNLGLLVHRMILGLCGPCIDPSTGQITLQRLNTFLVNTLDAQHRPQLFGQERESSPIVLVENTPAPVLRSQNVPSAASTSAVFTATPNSAQVKRSASGQLVAQGSPEVAVSVGVSPYFSSPTSGQLSYQTSPTTPRQLSPTMSSTTSGQLSLTLLQQQRLQQSMMLLNSARQFVQGQNLPEAFTLVEQALQIVPSNMDALILKGQILGAVGRFQEAMAAVDKVVELDTNNALAWSMRAALLLNMGRSQEALFAIDHSMALDQNNPETYALKATIEANLADSQFIGISSYQNLQPYLSAPAKRDTFTSFLAGTAIQILGLVMGSIGTGLLILQPQLPIFAAFTLLSLGLAILCVNAARGSYLHGATRLVLTFVFCLGAVGILGAIYKFGYNWLVERVKGNPPLLVSVLFLALWLALAATLPLLASLGGFIGGIARGVRKRMAPL